MRNLRSTAHVLCAALALSLLAAAPATAQPPPPPPSYEPTPPPPPPPPRRRRQPPPPPSQPQPQPVPAQQPYPYGGGYGGNQSYTPVPSTGTPQEPGQPAAPGAQPYPAPYQAPSGAPTYQPPAPGGGRAAPDSNYPQAGGFYAPPPPPAPPPEYDVREANPYASARPPAPPPPYHSGFYGRAMFGGGYTLLGDLDDVNMYFGTGVGVFLIENFALHLEGAFNVSGFIGVGPGLTYIVSPIDLTLSASFLASWFTTRDVITRTRSWSDIGPGGELLVGKQFRLNSFLGIGFGGAFHLARVSFGPEDQTVIGFNLGVVGTIH